MQSETEPASAAEAPAAATSKFKKASLELGEWVDGFGQRKCSDIHLSPTRGLWYVKDKSTVQHDEVLTFPAEDIDTLIEDFVHGGMEHFEENLQADASFDVGGEYRGRLAVRKTIEGTTATIRIISRIIPTVKELGLPQLLRDLMTRPAGLLLFTGQTGSGKSTSIAALVNEVIQRDRVGVYTVEDPIEYVYPNGSSLVNQREVGSHVKSFPLGVINAKRSHPKIIVIGEIVNAETASAALTAAASGHLVVSTMHAGSTAESIDGLISMFPVNEHALVRTQLAQSLLGVVVQQLLPRIGGGLAMAQEIALNDLDLKGMILGTAEHGSDSHLIQPHLLGKGKALGMVAMEQSLTDLVIAGAITPEQARRNALHQKDIDSLLHFAGFPKGSNS